MTTPVTTASPVARPAPVSDSVGSDSAEPFASALDGALGSGGRSEVDGAGSQTGGDPAADQDEAPAGDGAAPADQAATAPAGVAAALWALLTGAAGPAPDAEAPQGTPGAAAAAAAPVPAGMVPPGREVAQAARAGGGLAHGLHGTQPGRLRAEGTTPPEGAPAPAMPDAAPTTAAAAARAAADALAAAGVTQVVADSGAPDDGAAAPSPAAVPAVPSTGDAGTAPAPPTTTALPVAAQSGGTGADAGPGAERSEETAAGTDAVPTTGSAAPAGPAGAIPRAEAATGAAVAHPVSAQLTRHVAVLRGGPDGSHTMTVVMTPESLGPVEVSVTVSQGTVELTLRGAHEHGRAALLDAVPDLRRDLEAAGLTCTRLDVDRGSRDGSWSSSQQHAGRPGEHGPGRRGAQSDRSEGGARPWHRSADTAEGPRAITRTALGLDVRV